MIRALTISVVDVFEQESTLVCTAELQEEDALLSHGSILLPQDDSPFFGAYTAAEWMELRWFDVETCTEIGALLPQAHANKGTWMKPVSSAQLHPMDAGADAVLIEHSITYHTEQW